MTELVFTPITYQRKPTMREIAREVAERRGFTLAALTSNSRKWPLAHVRQEAMWELHRTGRFSLSQIGAVLGGLHHTTVLHGVRAHEVRLKTTEEAA